MQHEPDASGTTPGPATSISISSHSLSATCCCTLSTAKSLPAVPSALAQLPSHRRGCDLVQTSPLLHCSGWKWKGAGWDVYSETVGNIFKRLLRWATAGSVRKGITKKHFHSTVLLISHSIKGTKQTPWCHASQDTSWLAPASDCCHISLLSWWWPFKMQLQTTPAWLKPVPPVLLHCTEPILIIPINPN